MPTSVQTCRECTCETVCCAKIRLLNACSRLIISNGCVSITTRNVAEEADVNHALISYHFGGIANLIDAAVNQIESILHSELVPEVEQFRLSLITATPQTMHRAFEDACTRLVEFLAHQACQTDASRCLFQQQSCSHAVYPLYVRLIVEPLRSALVSFISMAKDSRTQEYSQQTVCILVQLVLSQLLIVFHIFQDCSFSDDSLYGCGETARQQSVQIIVGSLMRSLALDV